MSEARKEQVDQPQDEVKPELESQAEMPEDFVEPEGKSGKWGEPVKGEVEIEGKKVEVSYREKVIELPKHRQEETGIKRIRRRELLPPFPKDLYWPEKHYEQNFRGSRYSVELDAGYSSKKKFDNFYRFLTDGIYPSDHVLVHDFQGYTSSADIKERNTERFKNEGLYFQEIFPKETQPHTEVRSLDGKFRFGSGEQVPQNFDGKFYVYFMAGRSYREELNYDVPIFVFGERNKMFGNYIGWTPLDFKSIHPGGSEIQLASIRSSEDNIKPMKWCYADCALIPTKRSLNALFFETGDEKK